MRQSLKTSISVISWSPLSLSIEPFMKLHVVTMGGPGVLPARRSWFGEAALVDAEVGLAHGP